MAAAAAAPPGGGAHVAGSVGAQIGSETLSDADLRQLSPAACTPPITMPPSASSMLETASRLAEIVYTRPHTQGAASHRRRLHRRRGNNRSSRGSPLLLRLFPRSKTSPQSPPRPPARRMTIAKKPPAPANGGDDNRYTLNFEVECRSDNEGVELRGVGTWSSVRPPRLPRPSLTTSSEGTRCRGGHREMREGISQSSSEADFSPRDGNEDRGSFDDSSFVSGSGRRQTRRRRSQQQGGGQDQSRRQGRSEHGRRTRSGAEMESFLATLDSPFELDDEGMEGYLADDTNFGYMIVNVLE